MRKLAVLLLCLLLAASASAEALYVPGVYTGVGMGNNGEVKADVEFSEDQIVAIVVTEHQETPGIGDVAVDVIPGEILEAQSLDVDVVTGASMTSAAIIEAVADAAVQAGADLSLLGVREDILEADDGLEEVVEEDGVDEIVEAPGESLEAVG